MTLVGEQDLKTPGLGVGEQLGPGVQGASGLVERVTRPAPTTRDLVLDAAAALIELACSQGHNARRGPSPPGPWAAPRRWRSLDPVKPPRRYHLDPLTPGLVALGEPGLEGLLGSAPGPRPSSRAGPARSRTRVRSMMTAGPLAAPPGAAPGRGGTSRTGAKRAGEIVNAKHLHAP